MDLIASSKRLQQTFFMHLEVISGHNGKQGFNYLELHLVIPLGYTVAYGFNDGVDQFAMKSAVHVGLGFILVISIYAVVLTVSIE